MTTPVRFYSFFNFHVLSRSPHPKRMRRPIVSEHKGGLVFKPMKKKVLAKGKNKKRLKLPKKPVKS